MLTDSGGMSVNLSMNGLSSTNDPAFASVKLMSCLKMSEISSAAAIVASDAIALGRFTIPPPTAFPYPAFPYPPPYPFTLLLLFPHELEFILDIARVNMPPPTLDAATDSLILDRSLLSYAIRNSFVMNISKHWFSASFSVVAAGTNPLAPTCISSSFLNW